MSEPTLPSRAAVDPARLATDALAAEIALHNRLYFEEAAPVISDAEFDLLVDELRRRVPDHPVLHQVGAAVETVSTDKVEHRTPMLSLEKCYTEAELQHWARIAPATPLIATPKVDGLACSILYGHDGTLRLAATRGDGVRGENVTANVRQIPGILNRLPAGTGEVEVRGEVYLPLSVFETVADQFASPRNLAAGTLKSKEKTAVPLQSLCFLAYDLLGAGSATEHAKLERLAQLGFTPAPWQACVASSAAEVYRGFLAQRAGLDYEIDGVVFKFDDVALIQRLGTTAHHPRGAIAWKFPSDVGLSTLREVEWSVSRTGTITPVAIVLPVQLCGASVTRATLHNLSNVRRLGLRLGDTVVLARRGGVIPHLEATRGGGDQPVVPPEQCPSCGSPTRTGATVRPGAEPVQVLFCTAPDTCVVARLRTLLHYTSALDMKGFGGKVMELLLDRGLVNDPADLYTLAAGDLATLPRLGELSADNLLKQIEKARRLDLAAFLVALGIESLGGQTAEILASRWDLDEIRRLDLATLSQVHSLGGGSLQGRTSGDIAEAEARKARAILAGLTQRQGLIDRLLAHVEVVRRQTGSGPMAGEVVVFTGGLERMGRRDAQQEVVHRGGKVGTSVTAETTLLVVGSDELAAAEPSSKHKKAEKLRAAGQRIAIVDEVEFRKRAGLDPP